MNGDILMKLTTVYSLPGPLDTDDIEKVTKSKVKGQGQGQPAMVIENL